MKRFWIGLRQRHERVVRVASPRITRSLISALGVSVVALFVSPWRAGIVEGESMSPTLQPGQLFLYDRRATVGLGDIVLVEMGGTLCVKRVYAMGGSSFWALEDRDETRELTPIDNAQRSRFRRMLHSGWLSYSRLIRYRVPQGELFVVGDGSCSLDSRQLGPVPVSQLRGKVISIPRNHWTRMSVDRSFPSPPVRFVRRASAGW